MDCAEVIVAAYEVWARDDLAGEYNVARLVEELDHVARFDLRPEGEPSKELAWHHDVHPGDLLAVRQHGRAQFSHVGALYEDHNGNGYLDGGDLVLHAGPWPLHLSRIKGSAFKGQALVLRF